MKGNMARSLAEQVVLITGASAGIGAALATVLADRYSGIRLILTARRQEQLEAVAAVCRRRGAEVQVVPADMSQPEQMEKLVKTALHTFGQINVLVNNAGYGQMGPIELIPDELAQRQFQVNVLSPLALIRQVIPRMREQGGGRIINVSSLGGRIAFPIGGLYSASKFALEGLSDALRRELAPFNISVSVVEPGPVRTEFVEVAKQEAESAIVESEQSPYQAALEKWQHLDKQVDRQAWTSEQVADVILKAMTARHPKPRYMAATGGTILVALMGLLPTAIVDRFWQRFYGIDRVAQDWQQRQRMQHKL